LVQTLNATQNTVAEHGPKVKLIRAQLKKGMRAHQFWAPMQNFYYHFSLCVYFICGDGEGSLLMDPIKKIF